jgi:hypothetical protein
VSKSIPNSGCILGNRNVVELGLKPNKIIIEDNLRAREKLEG